MKKLFSPFKLGKILLKNRVIKAATFEGCSPKGIPNENLIEFHKKVAAGGTALTTVAYCGVSPNSLTFEDEIHMHEAIKPQLTKLTETVHKTNNGLVSGQMAHCGIFTKIRPKDYKWPKGPSLNINRYGLSYGIFFGQAMNQQDMQQVLDDYKRSAQFMQEVGFDAFEVHMGHGYLLSQFICPITNRRSDQYGGSITNRMRFPLEVLEVVKKTVGEDFPVLVKINLSDGYRGGTQVNDCVEAVKIIEKSGLANAVVLSGGDVARTPMYLFRGDSVLPGVIAGEKKMILRVFLKLVGQFIVKSMPYKELYFLEDALKVRNAVKMPLAYLGGASTVESIEKIMNEGFDFVTIGRALIKDPDMIKVLQKQYEEKQLEKINYLNGCTHCNLCVGKMHDVRGVYCPLNQQ